MEDSPQYASRPVGTVRWSSHEGEIDTVVRTVERVEKVSNIAGTGCAIVCIIDNEYSR